MRYTIILNRDVWVTVHHPAVRRADGGYDPPDKYVAAFRVDEKPGLLDGEYVRRDGKIAWFSSEDEAADAAFAEAERRLNVHRLG